MRVLFFSIKPYDKHYFEKHMEKHTFEYQQVPLNKDTASLAKNFDAVCCFVNDDLSGNVIKILSEFGIKLILLRCAGFNQLDKNAAQQYGITVARVPEYSPHAVAEHTVGLILTLNRHIHRAHNRIRENDYSLHGLMGFDLHGKTVGVIGAGKIGQTFISIMQGFGCNIQVFDPENQHIPNTKNVSLEALWPSCDIISLHCPLNENTHHLINSQTLKAMKKGAMLINTSRGGLINTKAVIKSLKKGRLGYLGIDVYEEEADLFFENCSDQIMQDDMLARLTTFPNVLITGHQAYFTKEALEKIGQTTIKNIDGFSEGGVPKNNLVV